MQFYKCAESKKILISQRQPVIVHPCITKKFIIFLKRKKDAGL